MISEEGKIEEDKFREEKINVWGAQSTQPQEH